MHTDTGGVGFSVRGNTRLITHETDVTAFYVLMFHHTRLGSKQYFFPDDPCVSAISEAFFMFKKRVFDGCLPSIC